MWMCWCALFMTAWVLSACDAGEGRAFPHVLTWGRCSAPGLAPGFEGLTLPRELECAWLERPLDVADPSAGHGRVRLAVSRLPARGRRLGTLVLVSGGPGQPGLSSPLAVSGADLEHLRESFDFVGYDPRGVGRSRPAIRCVAPLEGAEDREGAERALRRYVAGCVAGSGEALLRHVDTQSAVSDLESLRHALGEPKLTAVGYSYGTQVVGQYALRYPQRVRALVLDGVVDLSEPNHVALISQEQGYSRSLERFATYCRSQPGCPFPADGKRAVEHYRQLLVRAETPGLDSAALDRSRIEAVVTQWLLERNQWEALRLALAALDRGDAAPMRQLAASLDGFVDDAALTAITCADSATPDMPPTQRSRQLRRLQDTSVSRLPEAEPMPDICDAWPFPGTWRPSMPVPSPRLPQLLFVAHEYDPTTPHANARRMASAFLSPLLTRQGDGHTLVLHDVDACIDERVASYLLEPDRYIADAWCPASER